MVYSAKWRVCALAITTAALCGATVSQAGWLDRLKSKPRRATTFTTRRAQSPPADPPAGGGWQPSATVPAPTAWGGPAYQSGAVYGNADYCCGPEVRHAWWCQICRKKCDQTFYCPVPPYCYPCYGVHPTCWRQMQECYACPRVENPLPPAKPAKPAPPKPETRPAVPPVPPTPTEPPEPMDDEPATPQSSRIRPQRVIPVAVEPPANTPPERARWTSFTDAIAEDDDAASDDSVDEEQESDDPGEIETPPDDVADMSP